MLKRFMDQVTWESPNLQWQCLTGSFVRDVAATVTISLCSCDAWASEGEGNAGGTSPKAVTQLSSVCVYRSTSVCKGAEGCLDLWGSKGREGPGVTRCRGMWSPTWCLLRGTRLLPRLSVFTGTTAGQHPLEEAI